MFSLHVSYIIVLNSFRLNYLSESSKCSPVAIRYSTSYHKHTVKYIFYDHKNRKLFYCRDHYTLTQLFQILFFTLTTLCLSYGYTLVSKYAISLGVISLGNYQLIPCLSQLLMRIPITLSITLFFNSNSIFKIVFLSFF